MKGLAIAIVLLFSATCYGQERYPITRPSPCASCGEPYQVYVNPYSPNPPRIYSSGGTYLGELSTNRYAPDSVSNPYGRYGSRYSPDSINNPYTRYGRYPASRVFLYSR